MEHRAEGFTEDISSIIEENQNRTAQFERYLEDIFHPENEKVLQNQPLSRKFRTEIIRLKKNIVANQKLNKRRAEYNESRNIFSSTMKPNSFIFGTIILLVGTLPFAALIVAKRYYAKNNNDFPYKHFEDEPGVDMSI